MSKNSRFTEETLRRCLVQGDPGGTRLVDHLKPVLHARVARTLLRYGQSRASDLHEEVQEFIQEVFVVLFEHEAQTLRKWDPSLGMSLENYVGLIAERRVSSILRDRSRMKRAGHEEPLADDDVLEHGYSVREPGSEAESRQMLLRLLSRLEESLGPVGWRVFQLRFIQEYEIADISTETGMSSDAIYASVSRVRRLARSIKLDLEGKPKAFHEAIG